jgi:hypothetical protein
MTAIKNIRLFTLIVFTCCALIAAPSCKVHKCPANGGGYVDPDSPLKMKHHKSKLSNWPKNQKPY